MKKNRKLTTASERPCLENDDDHHTQPGNLFRKVMTDSERKNTIINFVFSLKGVSGPKRKDILIRQLNLFDKADRGPAPEVAKAPGIKFTV